MPRSVASRVRGTSRRTPAATSETARTAPQTPPATSELAPILTAGQRCSIRGLNNLAGAPDLNGKVVTLLALDTAKSKWVVRMSDGNIARVPSVALMIGSPLDLPDYVDEEWLKQRWPLGHDTYKMFICPITQDIMRNPVLTADGSTYEHDAIFQWLWVSNRSTDPLSGLTLKNKKLVPNKVLREQLTTLVKEYEDELIVNVHNKTIGAITDAALVPRSLVDPPSNLLDLLNHPHYDTLGGLRKPCFSIDPSPSLMPTLPTPLPTCNQVQFRLMPAVLPTCNQVPARMWQWTVPASESTGFPQVYATIQ